MWNAIFGFKRLEGSAQVCALFSEKDVPSELELEDVKSKNPGFDQYFVAQVLV
jgi:hypothetical protein